LLKNYVPFGNVALYPVKLIVTFFHEFGHALSAILTGGSVDSVTVNSDGSGLAMTA
jgi:Zn-dependent oligopeptidase